VLAVVAPIIDAPLAIPLLMLLGACVAIGIIYVLHNFVRAVVGGIAGVIGRIPGVGGILSSPVNAVFHWMDHEFGAAEAALDKRIGSYWHSLGHTVRWIGQEIEGHARLLRILAALALGPGFVSYIETVIRLLRGNVRALPHIAKAGAVGLLRPIVGELHTLERWTWPRVKSLERSIEVTIPRDIAGLRARTKTLERHWTDVFERIKGLESRLGAAAFAGAVAIALEALGASWVRCRNWNRIGKQVCGTGTGEIDALIGLLGTAALLVDFRELVKLAQTVEHDTAVVLHEIAKV
jgi:hypothetical protein